MQLAIVTQTAPRDWWQESSQTIATALQILEDQAEQERRTANG